MIDREQLMTWLHDFYGCDSLYFYEEANTLIDKLIASGAMVYDWISVKDELPEDRQEVIGWEGSYAKILYYDAEFNEWNDENGWRWELDKFPHWMPLPEPPKEKRKCYV